MITIIPTHIYGRGLDTWVVGTDDDDLAAKIAYELATVGLGVDPDKDTLGEVIQAAQDEDVSIAVNPGVDVMPVGKQQSWVFEVRVEDIDGLTKEQAERVMAERLGPDEDYGFSYSVLYQQIDGPR